MSSFVISDAESCIAWLEERCDNVTIHKAAKEGKQLSVVDQYSLLKTQQIFEKCCVFFVSMIYYV